ncbi:hypothetical protein C8J57DRAFT_1440391 [Mycena rebaudengoi]|nr:hypothetical protein C8J57DRAFT_1440391 [Mycena rebaudengoi]
MYPPLPLPPLDGQDPDAWEPFDSWAAFNFAQFHFVKLDVPWKTYSICYNGPLPPGTPSCWMTHEYELCTQDIQQLLHHQLGTSIFKDSFNHSRHRVWSNLMPGIGCGFWKQADIVTQDEDTHGCAFIPVVRGSDKTMVSVATSNQEYHPFYSGPGVLSRMAHRGHSNGMLPTAFLAIPKTSKKHRSKPAY